MKESCEVNLPKEFIFLCEILDTEPKDIIERFLNLLSCDQELGLIANAYVDAQNSFYYDSKLFDDGEVEQLFRELLSIKIQKSHNELGQIEQWKSKWSALKKSKEKIE
jgi:hypothetical protein